jgi:hypothetical protein
MCAADWSYAPRQLGNEALQPNKHRVLTSSNPNAVITALTFLSEPAVYRKCIGFLDSDTAVYLTGSRLANIISESR